jgi:hypothetical protein
MGLIKIELFEFALMINHPTGLTVIFPEIGHALLLQKNGSITPITHGIDLALRGPGGAELPPGRPTERDYKKFVVDLEEAANASIPVSPTLFDPAAPLDRTVINGRLFLSGGTIVGMPCSIPGKGELDFSGKRLTVTDTAVFEREIPDGEVFQLVSDNGDFVEIEDGSTIRLWNRDGFGTPLKRFESLDEFVALCAIVGHGGTPPSPSGGLQPMGFQSVCLAAQITAKPS